MTETWNEDDAAAAHLWLAVSTPHAIVALSRRAVAIKCRAAVLPQLTVNTVPRQSRGLL